jgi:hypothetical protein
MSPGSSESHLQGSDRGSRDWGEWCNELEHVYGSASARRTTNDRRYVAATSRATTGLRSDRASNLALPFLLGAFALLAAVVGFVGDGVPWAFPLTAALIVATVFAAVALWRDPSRPSPVASRIRANVRLDTPNRRA